MTVAAGTYPYPLGGHPNGRYRAALAQASSSAAQQASAANLGANSAYANAYLEPKPLPLENAGIRTGEIVGFRAWVVDNDGLLRSVYINSYVWQPGKVEHAPKVKSYYGEGIHSFKDLQRAQMEYDFLPNVVFGEVDLWGEVIEFDRGWKAEYAAVKSLICFGDSLSIWKAWWGADRRLKKLRRRYGLTETSCHQ